jgi:pimeloyl-ACP methyl ester carboxylesterase
LRTQHPVQARNALRQLWAAARYRAPTCAPRVPTLLLHSLGDQMVAPACTRALANAWQCPVRTHPWAGHDLPHDDGPWVVDQVTDWLSRPDRTK